MPPKNAGKVEPSVPVQRHAHVRPPKPDDTPMKQQRLPHIWAEHSPPTVILCLLFVAIVFIPIGAAVIVGSNSVWEMDLRYDHIQGCTYANNQGIQTISAEIVNGTAATAATGAMGETTVDVSSTQGCRTRLSFTLDKGISGPVYMYYRLKNFYQNYRLYAESRDDTQLMGEAVTMSGIEYCDPWDSAGSYRGIDGRSTDPAATNAPNYGSMMYAPCGAIAWSMFNDTISVYRVADENWAGGATTSTSTAPLPNNTTTVVCAGAGFAADGTVTDPANTNCQKKDIAVWNARNTQFKAPKGGDLVWTGEGRASATDLYLRNGWYADEVGHKLPIQTDEDFMVWTTLATLNDFRKLYRVINADLQPGTYVVEVDEYFDTTTFGGEKHVVLATRSWIGAKNHVLGGLFLGLGIWSFVIAVAFVVQYLIKSRK